MIAIFLGRTPESFTNTQPQIYERCYIARKEDILVKAPLSDN